MAINADLAAKMDFSEVSTGESIGPVTPGEVLREEFMAQLIQWEFSRLCREGSKSLTFPGVCPGCPPTKLGSVSRQSTRTWSSIDGRA
jgi:hypothetical protein